MCNMPYGKIYNGSLLVDSDHRGRKHTNGISIALLRTLMTLDMKAAIAGELPRLLPSIEIRKVTEQGNIVDSIALMCHDPACGLPWAHIMNGVLRIDSEHRQRHTNRFQLAGLEVIHESHLGMFFLPASILKGISSVDSDENSSQLI